MTLGAIQSNPSLEIYHPIDDLYNKRKEKVIKEFWRKLLKSSKIPELYLFGIFRPLEIQSNQSFCSSLHGKLNAKIEKSYQTAFEKIVS